MPSGPRTGWRDCNTVHRVERRMAGRARQGRVRRALIVAELPSPIGATLAPDTCARAVQRFVFVWLRDDLFVWSPCDVHPDTGPALMPGMVSLVLLVVIAFAAGAGLVLIQTQSQGRQREAFQALAAQRGWSFNVSEQKLGRPALLRLTSRSGHGWTVVTRHVTSGLPGSTQHLASEYESDEPHWSEGHLVISPPLPPEAQAMLAEALNSPDSAESQKVVGRLLGEDIARYTAVLRFVPNVANLTLLATHDPPQRPDFGDIAKLMDMWKQQAPGEKGRLVLILGPEGMRLRLRHGIKRADQMERFIDLALDLGRML
jgi:hypothetical protein